VSQPIDLFMLGPGIARRRTIDADRERENVEIRCPIHCSQWRHANFAAAQTAEAVASRTIEQVPIVSKAFLC